MPEIQEKIEKEFLKLAEESQVLKRKIKALAEKKATHLDSNEFAIEVGKMLSETFGHQITSDVLPDGKMYYNIAKRLLEVNLKHNYNLVGDYSKRVQASLNQAAGLSIKAIKPELNQDRIDGIVRKISEYDDFEKGKWLLGEPVINFTQAVVDDTIKQNADFQYKSGLRPKIIRKEGGHCCDWCKSVVGTYEYPNVPKDVYRRHRYCRCTVDYLPGDGKKQDVWSKKWTDVEKEGKIEKRKEFNLGDEPSGKIKISPKDILDDINVEKSEEDQIYELAKLGTRHGGIYRDGILKNKAKLEKSIRSHYRQAVEHNNKIRNPERYDSGWKNKSDLQKQGLLRKWGKDAKRNAEQAVIEIKLWEERFDE